MARETVERLVERANRAWSNWDANRPLYEDAIDLINPYRNTYNQTQTINKPAKQFDSTPMIAANNFVNTMQSKFTPAFSRWAELKAGPGVPKNQRKAYNQQLEKLTDIIFTYINASNFSNACAEMWFDVGLGTGCMFVLEGDEQRPLNFVTVPTSQVALEEGKFGTVSGIYRKAKVKARLTKDRWPDAKISPDMAKLIADNPEDELEFDECVYFDDKEFVWNYDVMVSKTKERIVEREFGEDVVLTPRYMKIPGYAQGIGPFIMALADIKTINKLKELSLMSAAINVFGVYTVANQGGINVNGAKIRPGAMIPVDRNAGPNGPTIAPLPQNGNFNAQEFMLNNLKDDIRQVMLDNRLPQESAGVRTAFEISERLRELQTDIGAAFGRLYFEFVQPLFRRIVAILQRRKLIELPKEFDIDNFFVQVQVVSPIAQAQATEDVQKFMQAYTMSQGLDGTGQLAQLAFKVEDVPQWVSEKIGAPATLLRTEDEKKQLTEAAAQAMQQQAAMQQQVKP